MTIAVDIKTGAVVGQLVSTMPWNNRHRETINLEPLVFLLTGKGYVSVPASTVRLETLR
jgi:hypothetical protein